jgi:uncharacterized protein YybS (DUF2232 family)
MNRTIKLFILGIWGCFMLTFSLAMFITWRFYDIGVSSLFISGLSFFYFYNELKEDKKE